MLAVGNLSCALPPPSCPRGRANGFTLLEMLVTMAIMALIAGLAFPALQYQLARRAALDARMAVAVALAMARADAIAHDAPTRISLAQDRTVLNFSDGRTPVSLPPGVNLDWPRDGITFFGDGSASPGTGTISTDTTSNSSAVTRFTIEAGRGQIGFTP